MGPCVIFNPAARGDKARLFRDFLDSVAQEAELRPTTGPGAARHLARIAVESGCRTLIAAGGDGTAFEVLNGMADAQDGFDRSTLGVLPLGTANVLAHELGMPTTIPKAWEALRKGVTRRIDCGHATFQTDSGAPCEAYFAIVAGAGLDARAVQLVDWNLKRRTGKLAYIASSLRALFQYTDQVRCHLGGQDFRGRAVLAGNGRLYAGDIPIFDDGALSSGRLHIRGVRRVTPALLVRCLMAYATRRWPRHSPLATDAVSELRIEADSNVPLQLDGELAGWLPATLTILPGALQVITP